VREVYAGGRAASVTEPAVTGRPRGRAASPLSPADPGRPGPAVMSELTGGVVSLSGDGLLRLYERMTG